MNLLAGETPPLNPISYPQDFDPISIETALSNIRSCLERGLPEFKPSVTPRKESLVVVGGGPSVEGQVEKIRELSSENRIVCLNDAQDWLLRHDITPWGAVFVEVEEWDPDFLKNPHPDVTYLVASHCHPHAFDRLEGFNVVVWHSYDDIGERALLGDRILIAGGSQAAGRTLNLGLMMGFESFDLFGLDSSFAEQSHAYYDLKDNYKQVDVWFGGKKYRTLHYLAQQADEFRRWCLNWHQLCEIRTHGDGLLQHIHREMFGG